MENKVYQPHKSSLGEIDANVIAALSYGAAIIFSYIPVLKFFAWLAPLIVYFIEKKSPLVKFHALQAQVINLAGSVVSFFLFIIGKIISHALTSRTYDLWNYEDYYSNIQKASIGATVFFVLSLIVTVVMMAIGIIAAVKAFQYTEYKLPVIGDLAAKLNEKLGKVNLDGNNAQTGPTQQQWTPPGQPQDAPPSQQTPPQQWTPPAQQAPPQQWTPPAQQAPPQQWTPPAQQAPPQQWTPPAQQAPPQQWTPPAQQAPPQQWTPPASPPAQPAVETQPEQPVEPPPADAQPKFDPQTGQPIEPPTEN